MAASSKKKVPAAKPVARRFKVAVPERITIAFDTTKVTWFNETTNAELRGWKGSEHELLARACRLSGFTPDRIVHQGVQRAGRTARVALIRIRRGARRVQRAVARPLRGSVGGLFAEAVF